MATTANLTIDGVTIFTAQVEEILNKKLTNITPPTSTGNYSVGPKTTKVVDLLRIEERFSVRGAINESDKAALKGAFRGGGVVDFVWDGETFKVNMDKLSIKKDTREDDHRDITFTCIVGENI